MALKFFIRSNRGVGLRGEYALRRAVCFAILSAAAGYGVAQNSGQIAVGHSGPLSGANSELGKDIANGAQAVFRQVNANGGVQGRNLALVSLDDKNDRATAGRNAKTLIDTQKAVALFGFGSATLSLDAIPIAAENKVPFVAPFTGADIIRKQPPQVFTLRASYQEELERILAHWKNQGFTKVAVLHYDDEVGKQNFATVETIMKRVNKQALSIKIERNKPLPANVVAMIESAGTEVIINTALYAPASELLAALKKSGRTYMFSSLSFAGPSQLAKAAGVNAGGVVIAHVVPSPSNRRVPVVKECADLLHAANLGDLNHTNLESCIAAKVLVEAMRRARAPLTRESLQASLQNFGKIDLGGVEIQLGPTNNHGSKFVDLSAISRTGQFLN